MYADHYILISARCTDLRQMIKIYETEMSWLDMHFNAKKSCLSRRGPRYSNKNSSRDEIANVNFLRRYRRRTGTSKYQKSELTSFNKLDDKYCALSLEFMILLYRNSTLQL